MLKNERHTEILEILKRDRFAAVRDLGEAVHASQPTIRRDLDFLERKGYVRRSHGCVVIADGRINTPVPFRKGTMSKEKMNICRLASSLIQQGQTIFIDASTTAFYLSEFLPNDADLTVITNGLTLCRSLSEKKIRTFSTGGRLVRESEAFVGSIAEETVKGLYTDIMFFSSSSLDNDGTISDYSEEETSLRKVMRSMSQKTVFLCDSGKLPSRSAFKVFSLCDIDYFVSNERISSSLADSCRLEIYVETDGAVMYRKKD